MHRVLYIFFVDLFDGGHLRGGEVGRIRNGGIARSLLRAGGAGDDAADRIVHEHEFERAFRERSVAKDLFQLLYGEQRNIVIHAGEGLPLVEGFAVAVVISVIAAPKAVFLSNLPVSIPLASGTRTSMPIFFCWRARRRAPSGAGGTY